MPEYTITYVRMPTLVRWDVGHVDPSIPRGPGCTNGTESNMRKAKKAAEHALRMAEAGQSRSVPHI